MNFGDCYSGQSNQSHNSDSTKMNTNKSDTPTPRTDKLITKESFPVDLFQYYEQMVEHARELERENTQLREETKSKSDTINKLYSLPAANFFEAANRIQQENEQKNQTILQLSARVAELTRACENMIGCQFGGDDECKGCGHTQCCAPNCEWHQLHKVLSKPTLPTDVFEKVKEALELAKNHIPKCCDDENICTAKRAANRVDEALALLGIQRKD